MMGFEIKFKGETILLPSDAIITVSRRKMYEAENLRIHAEAYDPLTQDCIVWLRSDLKLSDKILINIKEISNTTEPVEIFNFFKSINSSKEDSDKKTLDKYLALKKELEEMNLI